MAGDFDIGLERILRTQGDGKAVSLASSPDARDGARTTFCVLDETHRWTLPRLRRAHTVMLANLPKRKAADAWMLEITTAPEPGTASIAEATMEYARTVAAGTIADARLFFFHREASDHHDLTTDAGIRAAVIEASGPVADWSDLESIVEQWRDPTADRAYLQRVWLNQLVQSSSQAFDVERWRALVRENPVKAGDQITLGFDGGMFHDSTAIIGTEIKTGFQWVAGLWECPTHPEAAKGWQVPTSEVDARVRQLFADYRVWRLYADPPYWQSWVAAWAAAFPERVVEWWTNRRRPMTAALEAFETAIKEGTIAHDGDPRLTRHIGNSRRCNLPQRDEQGKPLYLIQKDRSDSPHKIDAAMAAVLSWEARNDAIAAGVLAEKQYTMIMLTRPGRGKRW